MQDAAILYRGPELYVDRALKEQNKPAKVNYEWAWVVVAVVLLVVVAGVCIGMSVQNPNHAVRQVSTRFQKGKSRRHPPIRAMVTESGLPPIAPLWWDEEEGAYMIELVIGAGLVELVLDTGSSQLSVKGSGCEWTNCEGSSCTTRSCPCGVGADGKERKDCSKHYYQPKGKVLRPGEGGAGTSTKLTYGSQEDTVTHYLDLVAIPHVSLTCAQLSQDVPAGPSADAVASDSHELGEVVVHRVSHIKGTSSSNLFGLARPPLEGMASPEQGRHVVLEKLYGGYAPHWSIIFRPQGGWWAMGALPCFKNCQFMPLVDPPAFDQFLTHFYVVDVVSILAGPSLSSLKKLHKAPRYAIIDTGTTYTYGSTRFGAALDKLGFDESNWFVQLQLGDKSQPVTITYSPEQMRDPDFPSSSVLQCTEGRTLDDYDEIFPKNVSVLLFGALMMRNCYWEFDLHRKRLGVQAIS
jgi:hypothetical protein